MNKGFLFTLQMCCDLDYVYDNYNNRIVSQECGIRVQIQRHPYGGESLHVCLFWAQSDLSLCLKQTLVCKGKKNKC